MKKIKLSFIAMAASTLLLFSCESKKNQDSKEVAEEVNDEKFESDKAEDAAEFLVDAAVGGMFEVEAAKIALQKASHKKVKEFAQHMVDQHSKANEELKALAAQKNVTLPNALSEEKQEKLTKLQGLSGREFDKEYMDLMVKDHKEDVSDFDKVAGDSKDAPVEAWASKTLPALQEHLEMAKQTEDEIKQYYAESNTDQ